METFLLAVDALLGVGQLRAKLQGRMATPEASATSNAGGLKASILDDDNAKALFWEAFTLGVQKGWVTPVGQENIGRILRTLTHSEQRHFYHFIGIDEQSITIETPPEAAVSTPPTARRRAKKADAPDAGGSVKEQKKEVTINANFRGAATLAMFAKMDDPMAAVELLRNSGTLKGITEEVTAELKGAYESLKEVLQDVKAKEHLDKIYFGILKMQLGDTHDDIMKSDVDPQEKHRRLIEAALQKRAANAQALAELKKEPYPIWFKMFLKWGAITIALLFALLWSRALVASAYNSWGGWGIFIIVILVTLIISGRKFIARALARVRSIIQGA